MSIPGSNSQAFLTLVSIYITIIKSLNKNTFIVSYCLLIAVEMVESLKLQYLVTCVYNVTILKKCFLKNVSFLKKEMYTNIRAGAKFHGS